MIARMVFMIVVALGVNQAVLWTARTMDPNTRLHEQYLQVFERWERARLQNPRIPPPVPPPMSDYMLSPLLADAVTFGFWGGIRSYLNKRHWVAGGWVIALLFLAVSVSAEVVAGVDGFTVLRNVLLLAFVCLGGLYTGMLASRLPEGWILRLFRRSKHL